MHILYHHRTAGDRVEAVHIMGMVRALRAMGHTVEICSPPGCDPEHKAQTPAAASGVKPVEGTLRSRLKAFARRAPNALFEMAEIAYNARSLYDMLRRKRRRKPDMILERTTSNSVAPTWLGRRWGIPVVQEVNVTTRVGRLRPLVLRRTTSALERWMVKNTTVFVTVSEEFKRMLAADGFPAEKIVVCQNAIEPEEFDPARITPVARPAGMEQAFIVGYVGAFVPWHGLDLLIESARAIAPQYPQVRWLLVGDGVERPKVERLLGEYGLRDRFWLAGAVKHPLVPAHVCAMDVAVMPHSNTFGSPMKLFEYMAMARAVVMPDVPAIAEVVRPEENGLLFRTGDASAITAALRRLIEDEALRRRLGARARQDALTRHTWRHNAEAVMARIDRERSPT